MALPAEPDMVRSGGAGLLGLLPPCRSAASPCASDRPFGRLDHHRQVTAASSSESLHPLYDTSASADVGIHGAVSLSSAVAMPPLGIGGSLPARQPDSHTGASAGDCGRSGAGGGFAGHFSASSAGRASGVGATTCVGSGAGYLDYLRCIVSDRA